LDKPVELIFKELLGGTVKNNETKDGNTGDLEI
jgi:hypothetical protein